MSAMDIDKPLDEIIKSKPRARRGGRGGGVAGGLVGAAHSPTTATRARYATTVPKTVTLPSSAVRAVGSEASKIIISNLPADVTEAAVRDLMQSTVGPVRSLQMTYTATGKSTGSATVLFKNKGDGNKAHAAYHNRMIDNQRPMKVELALDPSQMISLSSRVAPAIAPRGAQTARRGRAAGRTRNPRPAKKTAEELDAEMTAYKDTTSVA